MSSTAAGIGPTSSAAPADIKVTSNLHTLFTGIVFGLQPDALFVIIPALALPTKAAATAYILMFVFGTVAAMGSYTAFIGELIITCSHLCCSGENLWLTSASQHLSAGEVTQLCMYCPSS